MVETLGPAGTIFNHDLTVAIRDDEFGQLGSSGWP